MNMVTYEKDKIVSSKKDKKYHGFGVENIKDSVKKYGGKVNINSKNSKYLMTVVIKIQ